MNYMLIYIFICTYHTQKIELTYQILSLKKNYQTLINKI